MSFARDSKDLRRGQRAMLDALLAAFVEKVSDAVPDDKAGPASDDDEAARGRGRDRRRCHNASPLLRAPNARAGDFNTP
jgi:hypothetical protein